MYSNLKNHFGGHGVTGWDVECGKRVNSIIKVRKNLTEGGKEADRSNFGNEWRL